MATVHQQEQAEALALERLEQTVAHLILYIGGAIFALFGMLEIKNAPINRVTEAFDVYSIVTISLFIFVAGWITGATTDTKIQKTVLYKDVRRGKFNYKEIAGILGFFAVFTALFYYRENIVLFQAILLIFICVNVLTYQQILMRVDEDAAAAMKHYLREEDRDYFSYMKLYCAMGYLHGSWQAKRFKVLIALASVQLLVAIAVYTDMYRPYVPDARLGALTLHVYIEYLPSVLFLIYVLISESWMKIYRYKIKADFVTIERLRVHFSLQKKKNMALPALERPGLFGERLDDNPNYVSASLLKFFKIG